MATRTLEKLSPRNLHTRDSKYGRTRARKHAQTEANRIGRKVYAQTETYEDGSMRVLLTSDGPTYLGMPWFEYVPMADASVPASHPVQPLLTHEARAEAKELAQCGTCLRYWDDGVSTSITPTPSARCPFEPYH